MTNPQSNKDMKYTTPHNCPYCDSEMGIYSPWGMHPIAMNELKSRHDNGHPENISIPPTAERTGDEKKIKDYQSKELFKVIEVAYPDGVVRYEIEGTDENGTFSTGMFNDIDLLVEILFLIGKIKRTTVYVSK